MTLLDDLIGAGVDEVIDGNRVTSFDSEASKTAIANERENFRNLFRQTPEMVCILAGPDHIFEFVNEAHIRVLGFDATGMTVRQAQPESVEVHGILDDVYTTGRTAELREIAVTVGSMRRFFNLTYAARRDTSGHINGIMILGAEVTDQVLRRDSLAFQTQAFELALGNAPLKDALTALTSMVETQAGPGLFASILLADSSGRRLFHGAAPSLPETYNQAADGLEIAADSGSCGTAAFLKKRIIVEDIARSPLWSRFANLATSIGLRACWSSPILNASGQILGTFALYSQSPRLPNENESGMVDLAARAAALIIDRRNQERLLRDSEEKFRTITQAVPQIVWTTTSDGQLDYLNDRWTEFSGNQPHESYGSKWLDSLHPEDRERAASAWAKSIGDETNYEIEFRLRATSGEYRWCLARALPIRSSEGAVVRWLGTCTDIHAKKRATEKLETFWLLPDHLLAIGDIETGHFLEVSPAWEEALGYKRGELIGVPWLDFVHPDDVARTIQEGENLARGERTIGFENRYRHADGSYRWLSWTVHPIGRQIYCTIQDITELKQVQDELTCANEAALRAKEEAERANRLKSAFLANMSHEIRTPLGAMIGFTDLLRDQSLTEEERQSYLSVLTRNGEALSVIINDILDLSKVEAGHLDFDYNAVSPSRLAAEVLSLLHVQAEERGLQLDYERDASTPDLIFSDSTRVRQILLNIVGNAIKFTPSGRVTVRSYGCLNRHGNDSVCFDVEDTGIGISEEQQQRLFEMFVQGDGSMTRRFGGTGLGLALSRRLARELGGDVAIVRSESGKGTTFRITIESHPERCVHSQPLVPKTLTPQEAVQHESLSGISVLVVDDATDNQKLIQRYLTRRGATVASAENGLEGFRKAMHEDFDVILMDIQMPVMDGYAATEKLRAAGYTRPIIALTAHAMDEVRNKCLFVGCTAHLPKPIAPADLINVIARVTPPR